MKNGVEQDIENIESFYDVEKNIYNIAKILKNQDVNNISNLVNKLDKRKIVSYRGRYKMNIKTIKDIAIVNSDEIVIKDTQTAIDFIMSVKYETNCSKIAINKKAIREDFFILSTGIAGEILQKFINYQIKFAIIGDYSKYTSKPLKDFIYESNKGKDIFFIANENEAIQMLSKE